PPTSTLSLPDALPTYASRHLPLQRAASTLERPCHRELEPRPTGPLRLRRRRYRDRPPSVVRRRLQRGVHSVAIARRDRGARTGPDRKSTRLNSSHEWI